MAVATTVDIGTLITRDPQIRGGRPIIAGTGTTVHRIVGWCKMGMDADEIVRQFPHLTLAQVYAALTYYHANREEIDADIAQEAEDYERIYREHQA
jgi:uncharacterized protein (DUF433 family)